MLPLTPDDHALIAHARDAIRRNYDGVRENQNHPLNGWFDLAL